MGKIILENMEFFAFHGHYEEERIVGNRFLIDLIIESDTSKAAKSDNLQDAVNYQMAYKIVKEEMTKKSHLLENIAQRIIDALYRHLPGIDKINVKVSKLNPPIGGKTNSVSVVIEQ